MIRKTVSRAFGRSLEPTRDAAPGGDPRSRFGQMNTVFEDLRSAFLSAFGRSRGEEEAERRVTAIRQEMEGREFRVLADTGAFRFRNTMNGLVWILREVRAGFERLATLSLHPDERGEQRLVEKRLGRTRSAFRYTSISWLVESITGLAPPARATTAEAADRSGETNRESGGAPDDELGDRRSDGGADEPRDQRENTSARPDGATADAETPAATESRSEPVVDGVIGEPIVRKRAPTSKSRESGAARAAR